MAAMSTIIDNHYRAIIAGLVVVIVFFDRLHVP